MAKNGIACSAPLPPRLYLKETYFQTPKPAVPPTPASEKAVTPTLRSVSATSSLAPKQDHQGERSAENTMVYEVAEAPNTTIQEHETLGECLDAAWRTLQTLFCLIPSSELGNTESNAARMLRSYRPYSPYGYGSISEGATPTCVPGSTWSRAEWRMQTLDGLIAQPITRGNMIR